TGGAHEGPSNWPAGACARRRLSASQASRPQRSSFWTHASLKPNGGGKSSPRPSSEAGAASSGGCRPNSRRTEAATSSGHFPPLDGLRREQLAEDARGAGGDGARDLVVLAARIGLAVDDVEPLGHRAQLAIFEAGEERVDVGDQRFAQQIMGMTQCVTSSSDV